MLYEVIMRINQRQPICLPRIGCGHRLATQLERRGEQLRALIRVRLKKRGINSDPVFRQQKKTETRRLKTRRLY